MENIDKRPNKNVKIIICIALILAVAVYAVGSPRLPDTICWDLFAGEVCINSTTLYGINHINGSLTADTFIGVLANETDQKAYNGSLAYYNDMQGNDSRQDIVLGTKVQNDTNVHFNNANLTNIYSPNNIQIGGTCAVLGNGTCITNSVSYGYTGNNGFATTNALLASGSTVAGALQTISNGVIANAPLLAPTVATAPAFAGWALPKTLVANQMVYASSTAALAQTPIATITGTYLNVTNLTVDYLNIQIVVNTSSCNKQTNNSFMANMSGVYLCTVLGKWKCIGGQDCP